MTAFEKINIPNLDPRTEDVLVEEARIKAFNESKGALSDFSAGSPIAALIEAQAFCGSELLYYTNKLVPTLALQFYRNIGVERRLGTKSTVNLTFRLSNASSILFTIPKGFRVSSLNNNILFETDQTLVIAPGNLSGTVKATSVKVGSVNNVPAFSITSITKPLSNLQSVINNNAASGGTDRETLEETIERGNIQLRLRGLVSADDYEKMAQSIVGANSRFKAIGNLSFDKQTYDLGSVHLFGLDNEGRQLTPSLIQSITNQMKPLTNIATALYVSTIDYRDVEADIIVLTNNSGRAKQTADNVWKSVSKYISPLTHEIGKPLIISEVIYAIRSSEGVERNLQTLLDGQNINIAVPTQYTVPRLKQAEIKVVDSLGRDLYQKTYFAGEVV